MRALSKAAAGLTAGAALTAGAYLAALTPRRNMTGWEELQKYRYAHRGLHDWEAGRPENSLSAFRAPWSTASARSWTSI